METETQTLGKVILDVKLEERPLNLIYGLNDFGSNFNEARQNAPTMEEAKGTMPVVGETRKTMPVVEEVRKTMPVVEEVRKTMPVVEEVRKTMPVVGETRKTMPVVEEVRKTMPVVGETKGTMPVVGETGASTSEPETSRSGDVIGIKIMDAKESFTTRIVWEEEEGKEPVKDPAPKSYSIFITETIINAIDMLKGNSTAKRMTINLIGGFFITTMLRRLQVVYPHATVNYSASSEVEMIYRKKNTFDGIFKIMKEADPNMTENNLKYCNDGSVNELACEFVKFRRFIDVKDISFLVPPLIKGEKWEDRNYPGMAAEIASAIIWE